MVKEKLKVFCSREWEGTIKPCPSITWSWIIHVFEIEFENQTCGSSGGNL